MLKTYCPPHRPHLHRSGNRSATGIDLHRAQSRIVRTRALPKRRALFPTIEMETHVKKFLLAVLLIIGVAGCAPLTEQQKQAIDYQNHRQWSGG